MSKLKIKKGDTVYVLSGEDRGRQGRVLEVLPKKERAIVEGINIVSKSAKPSAKHPQGGIIKMEAPLHISNLSLIDPKSGKPTRVGFRKDEKGKTVKTGEQIQAAVYRLIAETGFAASSFVLCLQKASGASGISTDLRDLISGNRISFATETPEATKMVLGELVDDDVVAERLGDLHKTDIERDGAV